MKKEETERLTKIIAYLKKQKYSKPFLKKLISQREELVNRQGIDSKLRKFFKEVGVEYINAIKDLLSEEPKNPSRG